MFLATLIGTAFIGPSPLLALLRLSAALASITLLIVHESPNASHDDRARLGREFNSVREARDILVRYTSEPLRKRRQTFPSPGAPKQSAESEPQARPHAPRTETPPQSTSSARPPRVTMRFGEVVAWTDAAGFGAGTRSCRYIDWARIIVWSSLGLLIVGLVGGAIIYANLI